MTLPADLLAPDNFAATRRPIREASTLPAYCAWLWSGASVQLRDWRKRRAGAGA